MNTIHIKGYANEIDIAESLSDNYSLDFSFNFDEESTSSVSDVFFRFYESDNISSLEDAIEGWVSKVYGSLEATGQDYGYSEYTIEGFTISSLRLGGHDLNKIIKSKGNKYLHILIDKVESK